MTRGGEFTRDSEHNTVRECWACFLSVDTKTTFESSELHSSAGREGGSHDGPEGKGNHNDRRGYYGEMGTLCTLIQYW